MSIDGWKYYNHAVIPTTAPHEEPDLETVKSGFVWTNIRGGGIPLLARWTSDFDCGHEMNWWYVIKDNPFDITALKSKRRYEINKGNRNFEVRIIEPQKFEEDIYRVTVEAYSSWPDKYRPTVTKESMASSVQKWQKYLVFGAYSRENCILQGYAIVEDHRSYAEFSVLRVNPKAEKLGINAAIVDGILAEFKDRFHDGFYVCDGARSIRHETAFQDYLEKYFTFRKAYCKLNIVYRPGFGLVVKMLYPFRRFIKTKTRIGSNMSAILKMEEINRNPEQT